MSTRREFLSRVGTGALFAGLGSDLLAGIGLSRPRFGRLLDDEELDFGPLEPWARRMEELDPDEMVERAVADLRAGTELRTLVAAAALANARHFGGENYDGYHAFMALAPAWRLTRELPGELAALPVLKVLHRNTTFLRREKGHTLHPVELGDANDLHAAERAGRLDDAEESMAALAARSRHDAFEALQPLVRDDFEVHRVVLAWRLASSFGTSPASSACSACRLPLCSSSCAR